jgi:PAS domain S-box-containing protein
LLHRTKYFASSLLFGFSAVSVGLVLAVRRFLPTHWESYKYLILGGILLLLLETLLISALLWQRARILRDIRDREHSENVLRESEQRFRLVANSAPVLIWMSGPDKLCNFFNQAWLKFTGRTAELEAGDGWLRGVHPADVERCLETYTRCFDARIDFEMEYRLRRFDGEYRWIVDFGSPRFETDGKFCGYIGSCIDITERKTAAASLQSLSGRLIRAQDEERARISRELHDDLSQRLALQCIDLEQLRDILPESLVNERTKVTKVLKGTKEISADIRSLSHQLHSSKLNLIGLAPAIDGLCREFSGKYQLAVHFSQHGTRIKIPADVALCLFRVAQEALGNVARHSHAKGAEVELITKPDSVRLRVRDEGSGFDFASAELGSGLGLISMSERLRLVGGTLSVKSQRMSGTEIFAEVPSLAPTNDTREILLAAKGMPS